MKKSNIIPIIQADIFARQNIGTTEERQVLLEQVLKAKVENPQGIDHTNPGCWRDRVIYDNTQGLVNEIRSLAFELSEFYQQKDPTFRKTTQKENQHFIINTWTNVNEPGSTNSLHHHSGVSFACVYYLQGTDTGRLVFRQPGIIFDHSNPKSPFSHHTSYAPEDGDLIMWPSWMPHEVMYNESDRQRINMAFNIELVDESKMPTGEVK